MGELTVRAESSEEFDTLVDQLFDLMNITGGWIGSRDEDDVLDEREIRLLSPRLTDAELAKIWEKVRSGVDPRLANLDRGEGGDHAV